MFHDVIVIVIVIVSYCYLTHRFLAHPSPTSTSVLDVPHTQWSEYGLNAAWYNAKLPTHFLHNNPRLCHECEALHGPKIVRSRTNQLPAKPEPT